MQYFGKFTQYVPEVLPPGFPEAMKERVIWLQNEHGEDLYELRKRLPENHSFVITEDDNSIRIVHTDPQAVFPSEGGHLYAIPGEIEQDPEILRTKLLDPTSGQLVARPPRVPIAVSKAQAQMALYNAGLLDELEAIIAAHSYRPVRIWYESANSWERGHPYVSMLAPELNLTEDQIDALFIEASKL